MVLSPLILLGFQAAGDVAKRSAPFAPGSLTAVRNHLANGFPIDPLGSPPDQIALFHSDPLVHLSRQDPVHCWVGSGSQTCNILKN